MLKVFYLAFRQGAFAAVRRRLKISSQLCTKSSPLHWQIQLIHEPSQPGPRGGKNNLHSKNDSSNLVFLMPAVKRGLCSCCKVTLRRLEEMLGLDCSVLPPCFACCPQKRLLVLILASGSAQQDFPCPSAQPHLLLLQLCIMLYLKAIET